MFKLYKALRNYKPKSVKLEACSICQLNCETCYMRQHNSGDVGKGYLKAKDFEKFLQMNPYVERIELSDNGEVFLNPELEEIIKIAFKYQVVNKHPIKLNAGNGVNCNNVKDSDLEALVKYGNFEHITFSIDGASQEVYSQYRRNGNFDKVIDIDQSPIGRTPRSNPATYTGVFTYIRELFAMSNDAKERGYTAGRFSFNVSGGRCEHCQGDGIIKIPMNFLPDVFVPCEVCKGKRYNRETLQVFYKGKTISDVLEMTIDEAVEFFENVPRIYSKIKCLRDVGLGYIKLGQPATTLSGGEAQRVKLATELSKRSTGKTLYIFDEPTTGLHTHDVSKLIDILYRLRDAGNSIIIIEHNLDIIKVADHIIDLGPEGGDGGGTIIAQGTPEEVSQVDKSYTGQFLKKYL